MPTRNPGEPVMQRILIRISDVMLAAVGLALLAPLLLTVSLAVWIGSGWPVLYRQVRVGKGGKEFRLMKFRTMRKEADRTGSLTVGGRDPRITSIGYLLRRYKLDELPQLFHVLRGTMSLVGPRPEVPRYVRFYTKEQWEILGVPPGLTDEASLTYFNENELLSTVDDPEKYYLESVLPDKIRINLNYVRHRTFPRYLRTIIKTAGRVMSGK